jgi:multidrug efflux system membrane fusion protein
VVIHQLVPARVAFSVPEQRLPEIRRRSVEGELSVEVSLPGGSAQVCRGTLTFVDNAVNESTGTVLLKATFPNEDRSLWPGQFANVRLRLGTLPNAVVVPTTAIQPGQQGDFVFVIGADQTVEMRPVVVGAQLNGETMVQQGLNEGEQVVTDGQIRLVPGARVEIKPAAGSAAQPGPAQTGPTQADAP